MAQLGGFLFVGELQLDNLETEKCPKSTHVLINEFSLI